MAKFVVYIKSSQMSALQAGIANGVYDQVELVCGSDVVTLSLPEVRAPVSRLTHTGTGRHDRPVGSSHVVDGPWLPPAPQSRAPVSRLDDDNPFAF